MIQVILLELVFVKQIVVGRLIAEPWREVILELHYVEGAAVLKYITEFLGELLLPGVLAHHYNKVIVVILFDSAGHSVGLLEVLMVCIVVRLVSVIQIGVVRNSFDLRG